MAQPDVLVDRISHLSSHSLRGDTSSEESRSEPITIHFQGGNSGQLAMTLPRSVVWAEVLDSARQRNQPIYVEIDPATQIITQLLLPHEDHVESISSDAAGDAVTVELRLSQSRYVLRRNHPDFQTLLSILNDALETGSPVLVTETLDGTEIIHVRLLPKLPTEDVQTAPPISDATASVVTLQQAQDLFNIVSACTCDPLTAPSPCIPFRYPENGCWARAHEMCRLFMAQGIQPEKVWIYGGLHAASPNSPACKVGWRYHVAPTVRVGTGTSFEVYVLDPSLFLVPVRRALWFDVQGDGAARLEASDASIFYKSQGNGYVEYDDAAYTKTQRDLAEHRDRLKLRAASASGPPPYHHCEWRMKAIAASCLNQTPPISIQQDVYGNVSPQSRTVRQQCAVILSRC